jgi:hypothetical protein
MTLCWNFVSYCTKAYQLTAGNTIMGYCADPNCSSGCKGVAAGRGQIPAAGEAIRLVEADNQGTIFLDGWPLYSAELEETIDQIKSPARSQNSLWGVTSCATRRKNRYARARASNRGAERNLFGTHQHLRSGELVMERLSHPVSAMEIIFAIANENRKRGLSATSLATVWENWKQYRQEAALYPVSD